MTTDANGSATVLEPDAGIPDPTKGGGGDGSSAASSDAFSGLEDPGIREWLGKSGIKDMTPASFKALATKAQSAESLIGKSVRPPAADAKDEDWDQFYAKVGRPEKPDGYQITRPEALPEDAFEENAKALKEAAHKAGLSPRQAAIVGDFIFGAAADNLKAQSEHAAEAAQAATTALAKEFGGEPGTDAFKSAMHLASRALTDMGGKDLIEDLKAAGLVSAEGHILNHRIGVAFWKTGKALYSEDSLHRGDTASAAENPFKEGPDKGNITEQNRLIKADRAKAETLMREAGRDPTEWFGKKIAA